MPEFKLGELQWGHDQLIVEGETFDAGSLGPEPLQWGHDQLIVEGEASKRIVDERTCFNGATIS